MNITVAARELMAVARELAAMDFPTQEALDKYLKDHPDADRSMHHVREMKKETPAKKEQERKPISWKKNIIDDLPGSGKRYEHVGEGYTIDVLVKKEQGHPGSNMVTVTDKKGFLHDGSKMFKTEAEAEKYVEEVKGKLEKGQHGKRHYFTSHDSDFQKQVRRTGMSRERTTSKEQELKEIEASVATLEKSIVAFDDAALDKAADEAAKKEKETVSKSTPGVELKDDGDQNAKANKNWPLTEAERTKVATRLVKLARQLLE